MNPVVRQIMEGMHTEYNAVYTGLGLNVSNWVEANDHVRQMITWGKWSREANDHVRHESIVKVKATSCDEPSDKGSVPLIIITVSFVSLFLFVGTHFCTQICCPLAYGARIFSKASMTAGLFIGFSRRQRFWYHAQSYTCKSTPCGPPMGYTLVILLLGQTVLCYRRKSKLKMFDPTNESPIFCLTFLHVGPKHGSLIYPHVFETKRTCPLGTHSINILIGVCCKLITYNSTRCESFHMSGDLWKQENQKQ